jgi:hypothetical protein
VFEASVEEDGSTTNLRQEYTVTQIQGWVSGILLLFPSWELGSGTPPSVRAFNTVVNEIAQHREEP